MVDPVFEDALAVAPPSAPWFVRLLERSPLGPIATAVGGAFLVFGLQLAAWVAVSRWLGFPVALGEAELRPMMFFGVVLSFGPIGVAWCARMARGDLQKLRPQLTTDETELEELERLPLRHTAGLTSFLLLAAVVGMEANVGRISTIFGSEATPLDFYIVSISLLTMLIIAGPLLLMLHLARGLRRIGLDSTRIDLFELETLAPFGRFGVRTSLVPLGVFGLALGVGTNIHVGGVVVATLVIGGMSLAALLLPSLGVRQRIVEAKRAEVKRVVRALGGDRSALASSRLAAEADRLSTPELLSYQRTIEGLREWPIANEGWRRFAAYLLIPISTWAIKALLGALLARFF